MKTLFLSLCDICNALDQLVMGMAPGPVQDRFKALLADFDAAIDRSVGIEQPAPPEEE